MGPEDFTAYRFLTLAAAEVSDPTLWVYMFTITWFGNAVSQQLPGPPELQAAASSAQKYLIAASSYLC